MRNLICKIRFFKNIIGQNYLNINSLVSQLYNKSILNNSKIQEGHKKLEIEWVLDGRYCRKWE